MSESTNFCESSKSQRNLTGMSRRRFLTHGAAGLVAGTTVAKAWSADVGAEKQRPDASRGNKDRGVGRISTALRLIPHTEPAFFARLIG